MAIERTLSIIKPDAVAKNAIGAILSRFEQAGLKIVAVRMMHLSRAEAEAFYGVHKARPFFKDLVDFMVSDERVLALNAPPDEVPWTGSTYSISMPRRSRPWSLGSEKRRFVHASSRAGCIGAEPLSSRR